MKAKCKYYKQSNTINMCCDPIYCPDTEVVSLSCHKGIIYFDWIKYIIYNGWGSYFNFEDIIYDE